MYHMPAAAHQDQCRTLMPKPDVSMCVRKLRNPSLVPKCVGKAVEVGACLYVISV